MKRSAPLNPFSVQCHGPGNIDYVFDAEQERDALVDRVRVAGWNAELCGPHGVGKSTLLRTLQSIAELDGRRTAWWGCSDRQRWLRPQWLASLGRLDVVFLDGAERLAWWQRRWLMAATRACGAGLMMTTHARLGHGLFVPMAASPRRLALVVRRLVPEADPAELDAAAARALASADGNAREAMFALYEEQERTRRHPGKR